jgi:hypothetical protein
MIADSTLFLLKPISINCATRGLAGAAAELLLAVMLFLQCLLWLDVKETNEQSDVGVVGSEVRPTR